MLKKILTISLILLSPVLSHADELTHQLGNSGYAVRWAMHLGANKKSPTHYRTAVKLQKQAREKFRHENDAEAKRLSEEAYKEAMLAVEESK